MRGLVAAGDECERLGTIRRDFQVRRNRARARHLVLVRPQLAGPLEVQQLHAVLLAGAFSRGGWSTVRVGHTGPMVSLDRSHLAFPFIQDLQSEVKTRSQMMKSYEAVKSAK